MRIFCNGCSFAWGSELKDPEKSRYSTLLGQMFDAEVVNISERGTSLHRLLRSTYERCDPSKYDVAVLQFTFPQRSEYYIPGLSDTREGNFANVRPTSTFRNKASYNNGKECEGEECKDEQFQRIREQFIKYHQSYYEIAYTDEIAFTFEFMVFQALHDYFARYDVPVISLTTSWRSKLPFDLLIDHKDIPKAKRGHPNELGHKIIAKKIASLIKGGKGYPDAKKFHLHRLKQDHEKILKSTDYTD